MYDAVAVCFHLERIESRTGIARFERPSGLLQAADRISKRPGIAPQSVHGFCDQSGEGLYLVDVPKPEMRGATA